MTVSNTPPAPVRNLLAPPVNPQATKSQTPPNSAIPNSVRKARKFALKMGTIPFWTGLALSGVWGVGGLFIVAHAGPARSFAGVPLVDWAIGVSAIISPMALIWMVVAYAQRASDIQAIAEPLRRQLSMITGESGVAETRIRRFNQGIREQIELLKSAQNLTKGDFTSIIERVRKHRDELEQFESTSSEQVREIQDVVRRNMQQIENLMDDKFTMLRILDDRLVQSGDTVARQTEAVRGHVSSLLSEVDERAQMIAEALERSMRDGKKLADTTHLQEATLTTAAESVAETLNGLSGKIDMSVARFLERAGIAREEAERLAGALDAQTRSLEDVSAALPTRVSEAEAVMRGVVDRLYASEQLAREQAVQLTEKLSWQVDGLQGFLDRFTTRLSDVDGSLQTRRNDFDALVVRMDTAATTFASAWDVSMTGLNDRATDTMQRFSTINEETRKNADQIANQLSETTARYETSALRVGKLTEDAGVRMKDMTHDITTHLSQFETLRHAADKASADVQERAAGALQNLQQLVDRLLTARDATSNIGETLVRDLHSAVDQNEHLITRLNEAAQMSVRALGIAAESLSKQEGESAERSRNAAVLLQDAAQQMQAQALNAERGLREQAAGLMSLLNETRTQINATEQNLQGFAARAIPPIQGVIRQIDTSAESGLQAMTKYGEGLNDQMLRLQNFHATVGGMGDDMTRVTNDTVATIEKINTRYTEARAMQQEAARQTLEQFSGLSDRLQRELAGLDGQTAKAVESLQKAASSVGEQTYQLLQTTEASGAKMQLITSSLQTEATQIRSVLQKQADDLAADLNRAEKQFTTLGDALKQRTDAAYALLDRVAIHYNDTTRSATQGLEERTARLEQITGQAQSKAEALTATLTQQLTMIGNGTNQLEAQATQISAASGKALQNLSSLSEKITITHEAANTNARQTIARIDECNTAFARQGNVLSETAQSSIANIQKAASALGEQTVKLQENNQQIDQNLRQLTTSATTVHEHTSQIRNAMEQQNQRLVNQLNESAAQLENTSAKLEQTTTAALIGADAVSTRINDVVNAAAVRLSGSYQEMEIMASKADTALSGYGANVTQQAATLAVVSEQLNEQYSAMTQQNESQRTQLVDLFEKLGGAHSQAADVAERTIVRLTESLNQLQHQLGMLSDQSQTTVGNVRTASAGLSDQTTQMIQNAQAAEQQARTVLSVTATLHEQARQMQEQIQADSKQATDHLAGLVNKLTTGGLELRDFGSNTENSLTSLNTALAAQTRDLSSTMAQFGDRQRTLTTALDAQRDVLNGLLHRLALAQDETAATAERTASRLAEGSSQIARQMEVIGTQAQTTLANVQAANVAFADEAGALGLQAQQAEQQMRGVLTVTAGLQEQTRTIRETMQTESTRVIEQMNAAVSQLDMTTQMLKTHGASAVQLLDQTVLKFATNTRSSSEDMMKHVAIVHEAANQVEKRLGHVGDNVLSHIKLVGEVGDQTEAHARQLADSAEYATNRLAALRDSFANADHESQSTAEHALNRISEVKTSLVNELSGLAQLSQETVYNVSAAAESLSSQTEALRTNLAMSESALKEVADQVREENAQLPALFNRSMQVISSTVDTLKSQAQEADVTLIGTADRFITVTTAARESMMGEMRHIGSTADQATTLLNAFAKALADQMSAFQSGTQTLSAEQAQLVSKAAENVSQLSAATDRLAKLRLEATQAGERLAEEFDAIDRRASSTALKMSDTGTLMTKTVDQLSNVAQRAEAQITGASSQFREQLEKIRSGLQGQVDDINRGLMQITAQLERTGTTLRSTTVGTVADVERIAQRFDQTSKEASAQLTDKTARMRASTEEVAQLLSGFGDQLDVLLDRLPSSVRLRRNLKAVVPWRWMSANRQSPNCPKLPKPFIKICIILPADRRRPLVSSVALHRFMASRRRTSIRVCATRMARFKR